MIKVVSTSDRDPRRGASLVEFTLVALVFFMFLFGILEYVRFIFFQNLLNNAAREGARFAVVSTTDSTVNPVTTVQVQNYVDSYLYNMGANNYLTYSPTSNISLFRIDPVNGQVSDWGNATAGQLIGVTISGTYTPNSPLLLFLPSSMTVQATVTMSSEAN